MANATTNGCDSVPLGSRIAVVSTTPLCRHFGWTVFWAVFQWQTCAEAMDSWGLECIYLGLANYYIHKDITYVLLAGISR